MSLGIDVGSSAVKIVSLRRTMSGYALAGAARRALPFPGKPAADSGGLVTRALREAMPQNGRPPPAWVGLTGRDLNLQLVALEQVPLSNYRQLMEFEMGQRREAAPDHYIECALTHRPDGRLAQYLTLVGSARGDWIDGRLAAVRSAGVLPVEAVPNGNALFAVYLHCVPKPDPAVVAALLDIGAENMELVLVRGGEILFMRNVTSGARVFDEHIAGSLGIPPAEGEHLKIRHGALGGGEGIDEQKAAELRPVLRGAAGQLTGVINSTLNFARMQLQDRTLKIEKLYLSGGGARLRGLPEYIRGTLKMEMEILDPFRGIDVGRAAAETPELTQTPSDLACAVGLAMLAAGRVEAPVISMMPDPIKKRRAFLKRTVWLVAAGIAALLLMGVMTVSAVVERGGVAGRLDALQSRTDADRQRNAEMDALEADLADTARKTARVKQFVDPGRILLDSLVRLSKGIPKGLNLRGMTMRPAGAEATPFGPRPEPGLQPPGRMVLVIHGEISSTIAGGPLATLNDVAARLQGRGVTAEVTSFRDHVDRPGWRLFTIDVTFGGE